MYLDHFGLKEMPFSLSPNTQYFCNLPGHQAAFNVLQFALRSGETLIKITGEVGSGKTLLCRKLMNSIDKSFVMAYIPNPDLSPSGIRKAVARELGIELSEDMSDDTILEALTEELINLRRQGRYVVLLIDEAQALSDESLEALRLLTNIETESQKLLQIILFGQPELDQRLNSYKFRQLKQRITFSHSLNPIDRKDLEAYIVHRLMIAGHSQGGTIFSKKAYNKLYKASSGIPRLINILCHKAMLVSYGRGDYQVDHQAMSDAIHDTQMYASEASVHTAKGGIFTIGLSLALIGLFVIYFYLNKLL